MYEFTFVYVCLSAQVPLEVIVGVRVRPRSRREVEANEPVCIRMQGNSTIISNPKGRPPDTFNFDYSLWSCDNSGVPELADLPVATQVTVFNTLGLELLKSIFAGQVVSLVAYGQTGSGKTHSIFGAPDSHDGVIWAFCQQLFERLRADAEEAKGRQRWEVTVTMLEIYNRRVYDLLRADKAENPAMRVREHPTLGPFVEGLNRKVVTSYKEAREALELGSDARRFDATIMNER